MFSGKMEKINEKGMINHERKKSKRRLQRLRSRHYFKKGPAHRQHDAWHRKGPTNEQQLSPTWH